jgi:hypothetical protein
VKTFLRQQNLNDTFDAYWDKGNEAFKLFGFNGLPMTYIIDAEGNVRAFVQGERDWMDKETTTYLETLLREKEKAAE